MLVFQPALAEGKKVTAEWILEQTAEAGKHTVYLARDAVKVVCHTCGYQLIAAAPDWRVYCFRPDTKELWIGDLDQFSGSLLINPFALPKLSTEGPDQARPVTFMGKRCTKYTMGGRVLPATICANDIEVSDKAREFICRYYGIPVFAKMPLYRKIHADNSNKAVKGKGWLNPDFITDLRTGDRMVLKTESYRETPFNSADFFSMPADLKRTKEIGSLGYSHEKRNALNEMIDSIGFTSETAASPHSGGQSNPARSACKAPGTAGKENIKK